MFFFFFFFRFGILHLKAYSIDLLVLVVQPFFHMRTTIISVVRAEGIEMNRLYSLDIYSAFTLLYCTMGRRAVSVP